MRGLARFGVFVCLFLGLLLGPELVAFTAPAAAQTYPSKPIKLVSQYMAGATADKVAQIAAEILRSSLGATVTVEDQPGQEGVVAADMVARSPADGSTLLVAGATTQVMRVHLVKNSSFDPIKDFTPVAILGESPAIIVASPTAPAKDFKELLAYAKANPGKLKYATPRIGSPNHLTQEQIAMMTGAGMVHVPESGQQQREQVLASGQVDTAYMVLSVAQRMIKEGKARAFAVVADKRIAEMPDVPALAEIIPGFHPIHAWVALFGPANIPDAVTQRLNAAIQQGMADSKYSAAMAAAGYERVGGSPGDFAAMIATDVKIVGEVVKAARIQPQ